MDAKEFKKYGYQTVDWIADYLNRVETLPVLSQVQPGEIESRLPASPPINGEDMTAILADLDRIVVPGLTHWNHPGFFAYFAISGSPPGILAEMLAAAFNVNAMMWRTSPAATELEQVTTDWLRQMLGLPDDFSAVIYDTASISTLVALAAAREAASSLRMREVGLAGAAARGTSQAAGVADSASRAAGNRADSHRARDRASAITGDAEGARPGRLRMYTSDQAHSSVEKAALVLGIGQAGVRKIPSDSAFRMDASLLARAIREDRAAGWVPFCVVATVGTTSTTSVDPVPRIADICEREGLWLHVDGAYGGAAAILPEMRGVLAGVDRADSFVMNPHKWLFVPVDLSVLFCRRMSVLAQAFTLNPEYLTTPSAGARGGAQAGNPVNFMDYGPQLGRRFRALKLWFVLRYYGVEGLRRLLRGHIALAKEFAEWVDAGEDFERLAAVPFSTVCFRVRPAALGSESELYRARTVDAEAYLDALNQAVLESVNAAGRVFLSHTRVNGMLALRLAVGNLRTTSVHLETAKESLLSTLREKDSALRPPVLRS